MNAHVFVKESLFQSSDKGEKFISAESNSLFISAHEGRCGMVKAYEMMTTHNEIDQ
jgi:hypothetical protein